VRNVARKHGHRMTNGQVKRVSLPSSAEGGAGRSVRVQHRDEQGVRVQVVLMSGAPPKSRGSAGSRTTDAHLHRDMLSFTFLCIRKSSAYRTQLYKIGPEVEKLSADWLKRLKEVKWK
jgi:hypothetical protein